MEFEYKKPSQRFIRESNWFALFVKTNEEQLAAGYLRRYLDDERFFAFAPTKDYSFRQNGEFVKKKITCFKSYIFVATEAPDHECYHAVKNLINPMSFAYYFIFPFAGESRVCYHISDADKTFLSALLNDEFHIAALNAVCEGDRIVVTDTLFEGFSGRIKSINKYRRTADVEFDMFGRVFTETLMLDVIEKAE